ncbi:MAG: hypothetical protein ACOC0J_00015 [Myxococcota bacterium]
MQLATSDLIGLWISAILTLFIFSFLYRDNPLYKFAEHLFVGVSAGYILVRTWYDVLNPMLFEEIWIPGVRDFSWSRLLVVIPAILAIMMLMRLVPKAGWISRWPLAFMMGVTSGLYFIMYMQTNAIQQVRATMVSFMVEQGDWGHIALYLLPVLAVVIGVLVAMILLRESVEVLYRKWNIIFPIYMIVAGVVLLWAVAINTNAEGVPLIQNPTFNNVLLFIGVLSGLVYFFFSKAHTGAFGATAKVGIYFLMMAFGASFGYTIMARISLLIGRSQFLIDEWANVAIPQTPSWLTVLLLILLVITAAAAFIKTRGGPSH